MRFLFWNIQEKPNHGNVAQLTVDHDLDILVLAEARSQVSPLLTALNPSELKGSNLFFWGVRRAAASVFGATFHYSSLVPYSGFLIRHFFFDSTLNVER